jgi:hypothetical protein
MTNSNRNWKYVSTQRSSSSPFNAGAGRGGDAKSKRSSSGSALASRALSAGRPKDRLS